MRGDNSFGFDLCWYEEVSIHAPRMRGDRALPPTAFCTFSFNPRPSHEGRRHRAGKGKAEFHRFNPRPSHEGRLLTRTKGDWGYPVSIHAPRMRGDTAGTGR